MIRFNSTNYHSANYHYLFALEAVLCYNVMRAFDDIRGITSGLPIETFENSFRLTLILQTLMQHSLQPFFSNTLASHPKERQK